MDQATKHLYMKSNLSAHQPATTKVLLIGNNPREMGCISDFLTGFTWKRFAVSTAFDIQQGIRQFDRSLPDYVMLDEALGQEGLQKFAKLVRNKPQAQATALAILKNTNESEYMVPGVQDYLLKTNILSDTLPLTILNAIKLSRRKQALLRSVVRKSSAWNLSRLNTAIINWKES